MELLVLVHLQGVEQVKTLRNIFQVLIFTL